MHTSYRFSERNVLKAENIRITGEEDKKNKEKTKRKTLEIQELRRRGSRSKTLAPRLAAGGRNSTCCHSGITSMVDVSFAGLGGVTVTAIVTAARSYRGT